MANRTSVVRNGIRRALTLDDAAFNDLRVWRDLNQDSVNQAGVEPRGRASFKEADGFALRSANENEFKMVEAA